VQVGSPLDRLRAFQSGVIANDERLFLCACPSFELTFALYRVRPRRVFFGVHEANRAARRRVHAQSSPLMFLNATLDCVGFSDVEGIVYAAKDVDVPHYQTTMASSEVVRKYTVALRLAPLGRSLRAFDSVAPAATNR
jgi:hypothetical protein